MGQQITGSLATFNQLYKEMDEIYHQYAKQHSLSDTALWLLYSLYESGAAPTQSALCSAWHYPPQTLNSTLKGLERQGMIALKAVPGNRKNKYIKPTEKGREALQQMIAPLVCAERETFQALAPQERETLLALTRKYISLLQAQIQATSGTPLDPPAKSTAAGAQES